MLEQFRDDYETHSQYLKVRNTVRQWWVEWTGPTGKEQKDWFYYRANAWVHYTDLVRIEFPATTNAYKVERKKK